MKVIVQKVSRASCTAKGIVTGKIERGYLVLVGFKDTDSLTDFTYLEKCARKINNLRVFEDEDGKMNKSIHDVNGSILSISQFTLYAEAKDSNRPSFTKAMKGEFALPLYNKFNEILRNTYNLNVEIGMFGEHMDLDCILEGPCTIELEY